MCFRYNKLQQKVPEGGQKTTLKYNYMQSESNTLQPKTPMSQRQDESLLTSQPQYSLFVGSDDVNKRSNNGDVTQMSTNSQYFVLDHEQVARENTVAMPC